MNDLRAEGMNSLWAGAAAESGCAGSDTSKEKRSLKDGEGVLKNIVTLFIQSKCVYLHMGWKLLAFSVSTTHSYSEGYKDMMKCILSSND